MSADPPSDPYLTRRREAEKLGPGTDAVNLSNAINAKQKLPPMSVDDERAIQAVIKALEDEKAARAINDSTNGAIMKRYDLEPRNGLNAGHHMVERDDGEYVLASEFDRMVNIASGAEKEIEELAAEIGRLREALTGCVEHMEWSTAAGANAYEAARTKLAEYVSR